MIARMGKRSDSCGYFLIIDNIIMVGLVDQEVISVSVLDWGDR